MRPAFTDRWPRLPLFFNARTRIPAGFLLFAIGFFLYYSTNHYPVYAPSLLPITRLDQAIPFLPWTVLVYVSEYVFFVVIYLTSKDYANLNKFFYSFLFTQSLSCLIFYFFPTVYPRDNFPIPADLPVGLRGIWSALRSQDAPTNCFPSLHVSTVFLSVFIYRDEQREKYPFFFAWGTLIALSTLPTKQHYVADVVSGFLFAMVSYVLFHRWIQYEPVEAFEANSGPLNRK